MRDNRGFAFISLLIVLIIVGLSVLIGLRFYGVNEQESAGSVVVQDKAKDAIVQANAEVVQSLIQGALVDGDISLNEVVSLSQKAGLYDPFNEIAMNKPEWFPQMADSPGEIQISLKIDTFYIQGYGSDGLLNKILMVKK